MSATTIAVADGDHRYLNFGAGDPAPGWLNVDASPHFMVPRFVHRALASLNLSARSASFLEASYRGIRFHPGRALPFAAESFRAIYCSHVLEHLPAAAIPPLLAEFRRVLAPGGVVRIIVPDLAEAYRQALASDTAWIGIDQVLGTLPSGLCSSPVRAALEGLAGFPSLHKTMLVGPRIEGALGRDWVVRTGLRCLDSRIDARRIAAVETEERCEEAIIFELERP
jgi:SAM-dependent methyltransferase